MAELVRAGKVRHLGLSEAARGDDPSRAGRAPDRRGPDRVLALDPRGRGRGPADLRELGIGFVAYSPLGRGFLTGRFRSPADLDEADARRNHPRFRGENLRRNLRPGRAVVELAGRKGVTPGQLALAWVLVAGDDVVPIRGHPPRAPGGEPRRSQDRAIADELERLDAAIPRGATAGDRYPDMSTIDT